MSQEPSGYIIEWTTRAVFTWGPFPTRAEAEQVKKNLAGDRGDGGHNYSETDLYIWPIKYVLFGLTWVKC